MDSQKICIQLVQCGVVQSLVEMYGSMDTSETLQSATATVKSLLLMSSVEPNCGYLVQQGAFSLLMKLRERFQDVKLGYDSALAMARMAIPINPSLFSQNVVPGLVSPLLWLVENSEHELHEYEALLAVTNLGSMDMEVRERLYANKAWGILSKSLSSDNEMVQCAAVEALANLSGCDSAMKKLGSPSGEQDIRIFLLFAKDGGSLRAQIASLSGLAMMSFDENVAKSIAKLNRDISFEEMSVSSNQGIAERASAILENLKKYAA